MPRKRDSRTYITLHDGMPDHPKVDGLSDAAFRLLIATWCWCSRHHTDGEVPDATWLKRGSAKSRRELVAAGLVEEVAGGVRMHDYLEHQRSAAEISELSSRRSAAGRKGGQRRAESQATGKQPAKQVLDGLPSKTQAESVSDLLLDEAEPPAGATAPRLEAVADQADTAQTLIAEWIDHCRKRPPGQTIARVGKHLRELLAEGLDRNDVRAGLAQWHARGLDPSTLPSVVNELMNAAPDRGRGSSSVRLDPSQQDYSTVRL